MDDFESTDVSRYTLHPEDRLFEGSSGNWRNVAMLLGTSSASVPYTLGFREAADALIEQGLATHTQDLVLFPIFFTYRHAIELALKDILYLGQRIEDEPPKVWGTHRLDVLWPLARKVMEDMWPEGDRSELDVLERIIGDLSDVDPKAEFFRFDRDRDGFVWDVPEVLTRVDLRHVQQVMEKVFVYLHGTIDGLAAHEELRHEYEADMRADYEDSGY
jgi:hypothetical protein